MRRRVYGSNNQTYAFTLGARLPMMATQVTRSSDATDMRNRFKPYSKQIYDHPDVRLGTKILLLEAEVLETLLYGCMT